MNFYELFEKKEDKDSQDVTIADPKAALALKQARAKYTYAKSDLEAFVKMVQDEEEQDQREIEKFEADTERQEQDIKDLENKEAKSTAVISKLEKENDLLQKQIKTLNSKETAYEKKVGAMAQAEKIYKNRIETLQKDLSDLEKRLQGLPGFKSKPIKEPKRLPEPEDFAISVDFE